MHRHLDASGPIESEPIDPSAVVEGAPRAGARTLAVLDAVEVGVWEMTPGIATDVEADECFVVLAGRGEVTFDDGETIALTPGVVVRLRAGEATVWRITETLRKVYVS